MHRRLISGMAAPGWRTASLVAIAGAALIIAGVLLLAPRAFQEAFGSNFLATLAGVALGVPITVWLALRELREQAATVDAQEHRRSEDRRREVLAAIREELDEDKSTLMDRRKTGKREFFVPFLQDEVWGAMSDGGELRWVNEPALLRQLARSYHFVRTMIFLERHVFEVRHYPGISYERPDTLIAGYLEKFDMTVLGAIDEGIAAVDAALEAGQ